jgi:hypothetical protein
MKTTFVLLALTGYTAGCAYTDPYTRAGMWQPNGANAVNLAAMVADPADLLRGHGDPGPQSALATAAVNRLLSGRPKPLPALSGDAAPGSGSSNAAAAAPAAAAN